MLDASTPTKRESAGAARSSTKRRRKEPNDAATQYARDVVAGRIVAGPHVRAACERHLRDLKDATARGLTWDLARVQYAIAFFESFLRLNGGEFEGEPFILQPWQRFIVGSLFGWVWEVSGYRRFRTAYIETAKGNGKSPLVAGIGHAGLIIDQEPRAEIYAAATKKDQAMVLFRDAVAMADQSPELSRRLVKSGVGERCWNLAYPALHAFFRPISSDDGQSGPRPHIALVDEVHEHKDSMVLDMLRRGVKGRRQPLIVEITNSGVDRTSICYAHHEASIAVANARPGEAGFDDTWFAYICALDKGDDWLNDPSCWIKANPNLGVSIPRTYLEDAVREAKNIPSRQNLIARLNFCVWTESVSAWISREAWDAVEVEPDLDSLLGRRCYGGLDLSGRRDLTALGLFFPDNADEVSGDLIVEFWTPEDGLREREEHDRVPYLQWQREGFLQTTPGASIDYAWVARRLGELSSMYQIESVGYDRYRIHDFRRAMEAEGVDVKLEEFGQGYKDMTPAIDAIENAILNGRIRIHRNPVLRWNAASAVLDQPTKVERKFAKHKATGRIDGLVASTMAIGTANRNASGEGDMDGFFSNPVIV